VIIRIQKQIARASFVELVVGRYIEKPNRVALSKV